jgi:hypothetical protein
LGHLTPTHRGASDLGFKTSADLQHPEATERSECQGWRDGVDHFPEWSHTFINNPGLPVSFPGPRGLEVAPPPFSPVLAWFEPGFSTLADHQHPETIVVSECQGSGMGRPQGL